MSPKNDQHCQTSPRKGEGVRGLVILILFSVGILVVNEVMNTAIHENAHMEIGRLHGCTEYHYGLTWQNAYYKCDNRTVMGEEWVLQERYLHGLNEIIGYTAQMIIYSLYFIVLFYLILSD